MPDQQYQRNEGSNQRILQHKLLPPFYGRYTGQSVLADTPS